MDSKTIYILLTPSCNLECKYCFQGTKYHKQPKARASREVIDNFVEYCVKCRPHHVEIFGGEPLLCKDAFEHIVEALRHKLPDTSIGVVTNGTLIGKKTMLLESEPISVLLSLDGRKKRHDTMRGGFDRISRWLPRLASLGRVTIAMQAGIIPSLYDNLRYLWDVGFQNGVYINVIQNYGWYTRKDVDLFEKEYEKLVQGMLRGEGILLCARQLYEMLKKVSCPQMCGITAEGLACDWQGILYPCHRAMELGTQFAIGDVHRGIDEQRNHKLRAYIQERAYGSESARKYPLVSYCPVNVYLKYFKFSGDWASEFCEMITIKAKLVAKYYYEIDDYFDKTDRNKKNRKLLKPETKSMHNNVSCELAKQGSQYPS